MKEPGRIIFTIDPRLTIREQYAAVDAVRRLRGVVEVYEDFTAREPTFSVELAKQAERHRAAIGSAIAQHPAVRSVTIPARAMPPGPAAPPQP
jgi:hypothetical protein